MLLQCKITRNRCGNRRVRPFHIDSPVIYGDRVETSKPYYLIYIDYAIHLSHLL